MTNRKQTSNKTRSFFGGAAILTVAAVLSKIIGAVFKIPLANMISDETYSLYTAAYGVYGLLLTLSYQGIPTAMSRLVSASTEKGEQRGAAQLFRVGLPLFSIIGIAFSVLMFIFAKELAALVNTPDSVIAIKVLSPAVFFCCIISVYEGYSQGKSDMMPTAIKQIIEVTLKLLFGLIVVYFFLKTGASREVVAGGAISGAVLGLVFALPVLIIYKHRKTDIETSKAYSAATDRTDNTGTVVRKILKVSIPITLGACFMSIITLVDMSVVKAALLRYNDQKVTDSLYGVYSKAQTLFTMLPALLSPITVAAIPAIAGAVAVKDYKKAKSVTESAARVITLIAAPAAVGIAVLSTPVFNTLFGSSVNADGGRLVMVFGPAAFFACTQYLTTAILQANGHERIPMITFPIGGACQIALDYYLVSNQNINIYGSPYGTLACYFVITLLNMAFIAWKVKAKPSLRSVLGPVALSLVMGAAVWGCSGFLSRYLSGDTRAHALILLAVSVAAGVIVYFVLAILTGTVAREDFENVPGGRRIAEFLRLKSRNREIS